MTRARSTSLRNVVAPVQAKLSSRVVQPSEDQMTHRLDEFAQVIQAYNQAAHSLQQSHEALRQEVHRLQQELASTDAQLQRSKRLAALGAMAAGISHEIRNPLAAIQLYCGMLAEDVDRLVSDLHDEDTTDRATCVETARNAGQTVRKMHQAVRGLNAIVGDVLQFSREIQPRLQALRISEVVERALDACQPLLSETKVEIQRHVALEIETPMLAADGDLLHQAIVNVIRNAIEAVTAQQKREPRINIHAQTDGPMWVIRVEDNGPGIAEEDIDRIFNPFFTTRSTGTGLGLAIVHRIMDAHSGTITATNLPSGGACFELSLPSTTAQVAPQQRSVA